VTLGADDPLAVTVVAVIQAGDPAALKWLLVEHPDLASARLGSDSGDGGTSRPLHVATNWPGHVPNGAAIVAALVEASAKIDARYMGPHERSAERLAQGVGYGV
jgi:hypothetical protein